MAGVSRLLSLFVSRHLRSSLAAGNRRFISSSSPPLLRLLSAGGAPRVGPTVSTRWAQSTAQICSSAAVFSTWTPELTRLVDRLVAGGYSDCRTPVASYAVACDDDSFAEQLNLSEEFVRIARICLSFARDRPDGLRSLNREDVKVIVNNCNPSLFKNGANSAGRLMEFLSHDNEAIHSGRAQTVDIMRYLLSYVHSARFDSDVNNDKAGDLISPAVRSLLTQLVNITGSVGELKFFESMQKQQPSKYDQFSRPPWKHMEMKKGDWICPKCSFMNFAKNIRCLECEEGRPKSQLAGGEWECPQCNFFNYSRNLVCLKCDCKRPGDSLPASADSGFASSSSLDRILNRSNLEKSEIERKLAANDEKAERWFSKVSQLDDSSDLSSAIADEDFPEIMPLRKGVNRFVVSTRKTPLERRLANAQYKRSLGNDGLTEGFNSQLNAEVTDKTESSISESLDRILGRTRPGSTNQTTERPVSGDRNVFDLNQRVDPVGDHSAQLPNERNPALSTDSLFRKMDGLQGQIANNKASDLSDASQRYSVNDVEHGDATQQASAIHDVHPPDVMPMRKGENHFIVSKKKDRTFTPPPYKRRIAMEQSTNTDFVPFVPFPPNYFAKKDKQPEYNAPAGEPTDKSSLPVQKFDHTHQNWEETSSGNSNSHLPARNFNDPSRDGWNSSGPSEDSSAFDVSRCSWSSDSKFDNSKAHSFGRNLNNTKISSGNADAASKAAEPPCNSWNSDNLSENRPSFDGPSSSWGSDARVDNSNTQRSWRNLNNTTNYSGYANSAGKTAEPSQGAWSSNSLSANRPPLENAQRSSSSPSSASSTSHKNWIQDSPRKSLEGSAVTEPDPLDMSEEAKAERWFRRVAQIKDISELANIPDEDFPEIMPMRKGVNRFVVSKRKTPLERRLASAQYRRNLPTVSSDPEKDSS